MSCALYRHFDADDALLYVGVTNNPKRRLAEHRCRAIWADQISRVEVKWFHSRDSALAAEKMAIYDESPIFNGGFSILKPTGDAFVDWMRGAGLTQGDIAKEFGIGQAAISHIVTGQRRASLKFAIFIEDESAHARDMLWITAAYMVATHCRDRAAR